MASEARYVGPDGRGQVVQLPGAVPRGGNAIYDPAVHKGRLHCSDCDARMNFDPGSDVIAGGLKGPSPHFQRNPGERHEDHCPLPLRMDEGRDAEYDLDRGYRIHLNTRGYSEIFNDAAYPYERDENNKLVIKDSGLRGMEPFSVKSADDLLRLMRRGDSERLNKSIVIQRGAELLPWPAFFVRYARSGPERRFINLVRRLRETGIRPALIEVFNEKAVWPQDLFDHKLHGESRKIEYREDGRRHVIVPRIWLDNRDDDYVRHALAQPGRYLVLGYPRLTTVERGKTSLHFLNISVTDRRQIAAADVDALAQTAHANRERRAKPSLSP